MNPQKTKKDITIICVAYKRYRQIPVLIHSFLCQTLQNWQLHIIHDGYDAKMEDLLQPYHEKHPEITYEFSEIRHNDYGHSLRELGIRKVTTEFILITNDDNYYVPSFLELMFQEIFTNKLDLLLCDMVHSHLASNDGGMQYLKDQYGYFRTYPNMGLIDIGCFIVRTDIAKQVGFRDKTFFGDGTFVEDIKKKFAQSIRVGKLNKVLFVHN